MGEASKRQLCARGRSLRHSSSERHIVDIWQQPSDLCALDALVGIYLSCSDYFKNAINIVSLTRTLRHKRVGWN